MVDSVVDFAIWIASAFGAKLPDGPFLAVFGVEEFDELREWIAVGELWICCAWSGSCDDCRWD